ncbi:type II secretion system protein J [Leifsonia sp. 2TAF2]|uniref:PulJ/GspJ family protein n=1 Tax=Leifsonia sp. 2TAF2 TaxID=3233009 RepID=UPI003F9CC7B7
MIRLARSLRARARVSADAGLSLIELLVAIALTTVVTGLAVSLFAIGTHSVSLAQSVDGGTRQASNGMNQLARMLRAATPDPLANPPVGTPQNDPAIISASAQAITFYAYVNLSGGEAPVKVTYQVVGGVLQEWQYAATTTTAGVNGHWDFATAATSTRALCNSIPASTAVFRYFNKVGTELLPATFTDATSRGAITSVQVTITIQPTGAASAVTLTNTIGMANIGAGS